MLPEEKARTKIDQWLEQAGWKVINRDEYEDGLTAVAVREALMMSKHEADYLLFIDGKAVAVLEAKRAEVDAGNAEVIEQVVGYSKSVPRWCSAWRKPLPLLYTSNGKQLLFARSDKDEPFAPIPAMHTPKQMVDMLGIDIPFAGLPQLRKKGLRQCQFEAQANLEKSFRQGQMRALIALATGAGKTFAACNAAYRLLTYTPMRRALFLVDRNNLGKQALSEFSQFRLTATGDAFSDLLGVCRLTTASIPKDANVVICTIQRLFAFLKGEAEADDDGADPDHVELPDNPALPRDYFDLIIIDECHRSIYGLWRQVLDYFHTARMIGLTATPEPDTLAFFNHNVVVNYTLEQSIADGVNVDMRVYRIITHVTQHGGTIAQGEEVKVKTNLTGSETTTTNPDNRTYTPAELNRSVINPAQIRTVLTAYRDKVYTEMFCDPQREPNFDFLPKTLVFALNEAHATLITAIAKEVFHRNDDRFVQKITYSAPNSDELIRQFRNDVDFRMAVTCTLVATGTDVKALEVLIFMRDVASSTLYTQMKGRGVRTIGDDQLRAVTPNAVSKDCFFLVDAVGVTEHEHTIGGMGEGTESDGLTLKALLERMAHGELPDRHIRRLAAVLARLYKRYGETEHRKFMEKAGADMRDLARQWYNALEKQALPPYESVDQPNTERKALVAPVTTHHEAMRYILELAAGYQTTLKPGEDSVVFTGFSIEEAKSTTDAFEKYCQDHRDDIEALRIIYNNSGEPITYDLLRDLETKLKNECQGTGKQQLWNCYHLLKPEAVRTNTLKAEREALTNLIQLARYAYHKTDKLECLLAGAGSWFNLWCGQNQRKITPKQKEVMRQIVDYLASNGFCTLSDLRTTHQDQANALAGAFGGADKTNEALASLYKFVILRKTA